MKLWILRYTPFASHENDVMPGLEDYVYLSMPFG